VARQSRPHPQEEHKRVEDVCRLHRPQQALPQGPLRVAADRSSHRLHCELRPTLLPRLLLRVPPDLYQGRRPGEDHVHHPVWRLLLHDNVIRVEERWRYVPTSYLGLFQETAQQERRSLCG
jgi:hypothetical protein